MAGKRDKPEDVVLKLRRLKYCKGKVWRSQRRFARSTRSQQTYYRWRKQYGGMSRDQLKWLKVEETENTGLRRAVSDLTLDKMILTEAA